MSIRFTRFQHTSSIIQRQSVLRVIMRNASRFAALEQIVHAQLPSAAAPFCHLANYQNGRLVLLIDNALWVTRLRYQQNQLLERLARYPDFADLQRIQLKVKPNPSFHTKSEEDAEKNHLSREAGDMLKSCAENITDPQLRAALERLARHANKR